MNNDDQKNSEEIETDPEDQSAQAINSQEMARIQQTAEDLMTLPYDQLQTRYKSRNLNSIIAGIRTTNTNVIDHLLLIRHLFILNFVPPTKTNLINNKTKEKIVSFLAKIDPKKPAEEVLKELQTIDVNLILPANFNPRDTLAEAQRLHNASINLKNIISENIAETYLADVLHLYRLPTEKLDNLSREISSLSEKLQIEYSRLEQNQSVNLEVLDQAINLLAQTGRTPVTIEDLKENKNLGDVTDLILQVSTALQVVNELNANNPSTKLSEQAILGEIKKHIYHELTL